MIGWWNKMKKIQRKPRFRSPINSTLTPFSLASSPQEFSMNRIKISVLVTMFLVILFQAGTTFGIPIFARKYNVSCFACHTAFPTLNEFGQRFKANGYQIPATVEDTPIWDSNQLPIAAVAHSAYEDAKVTDHTVEGASEKTSGFADTGVDVLSGGTLTKHVSYFLGLPIEEGAVEVEQSLIILNNLLSSPTTGVNLKIGKFFLDTPFAENLMVPGAVNQTLFLSPVEEGFALGSPQLGVAVMGLLTNVAGGLRYEAGIFNGNNISGDNNRAKDFYARVTQAVNINSAPLRVGVLVYHGKQPVGEADSSFNRVAFDFELYDPPTKRVYVYGEFMHGKDDDSDAVDPGDQPFEFNGVFVGANVLVKPEQLLAFIKYDHLDVSKQFDLDPAVIADFGNVDTVSSIDVGIRYFLIANVALQVEFINERNIIGYPANGAARVIDVDSRTFAVGFDFDF
jgi:hypothetical protein